MATVKVVIDYSDGHYSLFKADGYDLKNPLHTFVDIDEEEWRAYQAFQEVNQFWHQRLVDLDNQVHNVWILPP